MSVETSIVIRTLNEARHLEKLLLGIQHQNYRDWEVVLVDSGSTDGTLEIAQRHGANIYHIPQDEFTYGRSLNVGCSHARGKYLAFASGHVWPITNNWLQNMVKPFQDPSVAMVYGRQRGTDASRLSELRDLENQFGPTSHILLDEPKGNNGNAAVRRDLWLDQPFDESLPGLEDVDWARRVEKKGYRVYYAADAVVYHAHEETLRQVHRRHFREAVATKRMFPHNRFTWSDIAKGLPYFTVRDVLYALRKGKSGKIFQVPGTRLAQFLGMYRGFRHHEQLSRELIHRLEIPEYYNRVIVDGPGRHGLQRTEMPSIGPKEVLVQVAYASACSTDLDLANAWSDGPSKSLPHYPAVPGEVYSGIVVRTGSKIGHLPIGQKVVGDCIAKNAHSPGRVANTQDKGASPQDAPGCKMNGAYTQYIVTSSGELSKLPLDIQLKQATLIKRVAFCVEGLRKLKVAPRRSACVLGAGSIGNLCTQVLVAWGLRVTIVDSEPRWLSILHKYDVDTLTEAGDLDRYDYVVYTGGISDVATHLRERAWSPGTLLLIAPFSRDGSGAHISTISAGDHVASASSANDRECWQEAIRLVRKGVVSLDDHTAAVEPLAEYGRAWDSLRAREHFNVLLSVSKELEAL